MTQPKVKLADGNIMPQLGLGVWRASSEDTVIAVTEALSIGYRAIDTAAIYKNEEAVGQALSSANLPREEVFITTKLWNGDHTDPQKALEESLRKLQLDHVDLYLIHWPLPQQNTFVDAWRGLIKLQEQGLAKSIGVSNFHIHHLQQLKEETGVLPVIDQVELHPLLQQKQLHAWNATHHIQTESWSPLAQGGEGVFDHPIIRKLAMKYGKTPAQIVIRWHLDCGLVVIPKSVTPARIKENFEVFDFRLDKDELGDIAKLDCGKRLGSDPDEPRND
ncbi:2,5-didehydrogluconate reductase DkgA [Pectobacterium atrosepticum]|uniref:2,5-didehydrogluconate reductase DkgA n=1 Tax=Pectobacterium atrosepticum TaxID=29471 RepID=UPI00039DD4B5|nr:2,5-didehydrogluconate reductase DkgA [Pectobacterium atrosepticum]GKV85978.1 2,5-diketo-D-gluconate reductase A [Pectobacterium carotovorum subsp. carotovorum]AIA69365.1 2,5-diketo-D-gluconic acid reductase [Pectobacterium atrosepticum]AIK12272.1 2,5-diketo-D-gluconic acid reductase A [Pectobacterium atrosepticum]ATY89213.1 2,5-didehydrogluconate reductase DkgA [Pectobacterium atrosepticum]KFX15787.1 2,5-diketo-D-gluconic acid reductase [Pectobacterium atrosepticum]